MLIALRIFVMTVVLAAGAVQAQECTLGSAPACGGTCPAGFVCDIGTMGLSQCECVVGEPLTVTKLAIKLNFAKVSQDTILLQALLPVATDYDPAGADVNVDVGGFSRLFILDDNGKAKVSDNTCKAQVKKDPADPARRVLKISVKLPKNSVASQLVDENLLDETVKKGPREVVVTTMLGAKKYRANRTLLYTAKQGKTGSAK